MRKLLFAGFAAVSVVSAANASTITYTLVPGPGGAGTFALTASTSAGDNFGLDYYVVELQGAATIQHVNVSPRGFDLDTALSYGFSLACSADNVSVISAFQDSIGGGVAVYGMGQTAGTLKSLLPAGDAFAGGRPDANGTYAAPIVLATGTYLNNVPPTILSNSFGYVFTSKGTGGAFGQFAYPTSIVINNWGPIVIDNVNANDPGMVTRDLSIYYTGPPPNQFWSLGYKSPAGVFSDPTLAHPATLDPITKEFRWNTTGAALGEYYWHSAYLDNNGNWTPHIDLTVRITAVPEPSAVALVPLTVIGLAFRFRAGQKKLLN